MAFVEDLFEDILLGLDVQDLIRFKIVCKSWYSLISSHRFVKAHLLRQQQRYNCCNKDPGQLRIAMPNYWKVPNERLFKINNWVVVGSSNGLVCFFAISPGDKISVVNPWTREFRKLPMPPFLTKSIRDMSLSFGYDSSTDDYKLVLGNPNSNVKETFFQVFSLKSNTWKFIGVFKYKIFYSRPGILFQGAIHWLAYDYNDSRKKRVLLSFDLSREEFTVTDTPAVDHSRYPPRHSYVGIVEDQLCNFFSSYSEDDDRPCNNIWVMKSCQGERFWEKLPDNYLMNYQVVVHYMKTLEVISSNNIRMTFFCDDNKCFSRAWFHIGSPLFVPSLISPYAGRPSHTENNEPSWSRKGINGGGLQLQASIRSGIIKASEKETREIEAFYRRQVGETENFYFQEEGWIQRD